MKTALDCYPCFMRQALSAARRAGADEALQHRILQETMSRLGGLGADSSPIQMAAAIHRLVREQTGSIDPYRADKEEATHRALALYARLEDLVRHSDDPLEVAVRIAIAGNIIDLGAAETYDLEGTLQRVLHQPFAIDGMDRLRNALAGAQEVLYLADNAGETLFDRVLIEVLPVPVTYVVKAAPVINDATHDDAIAAGIDRVATVIDNGSDAPGTLLEACSTAFRTRFDAAGLILAKGQGNYESLSSVPAPVFFLLQAKCQVIAGDLGVDVGSIVLKAPAEPTSPVTAVAGRARKR